MAILKIISLLTYLATIVLFWHRIKQTRPDGNGTEGLSPRANRNSYLLLTGLAVTLHGIVLYGSVVNTNKLDIALGHIASLVCLMTVVVFLIGSMTRNILNLGALVMPIGLLGLLVGVFFPGQSQVIAQAPLSLWFHLAIAILAFGILCIAAAQALLLYIQEKQLHSANPGGLFPALPAIQTMESNLFVLTLIGALLLTANLITGMISSFQVHGQTLVFNHHILLSFIAWLGFCSLLIGHKIYGWRGRIAAKWTLFAFLVLVLAYFGTRFVKSIILG